MVGLGKPKESRYVVYNNIMVHVRRRRRRRVLQFELHHSPGTQSNDVATTADDAVDDDADQSALRDNG